jgi:DNA polymerase III delta prime subunit
MLLSHQYKPVNSNELIGNTNHIKRIRKWLMDWKLESKKAILVSGPPGIGKTSCVHLIGEETGYTIMDTNASDARTKKKIEARIHGITTSLSSLNRFIIKPSKKTCENEKTLIIMDEIDGMGNGDRGGIAYIKTLVEKTKIPIICICNDYSKQSMKPLRKLCLHLKFKESTSLEIYPRMKMICDKEGMETTDEQLMGWINGSMGDIRSIVNQIQWMGRCTKDKDSNDPLQMVKDLLTSENPCEYEKAYFTDPFLTRESVQFHYPYIQPRDGTDSLKAMADASEYICRGDVINKTMYSRQGFSLMPYHALFSVGVPCQIMNGRFNNPTRKPPFFIGFPLTLGKISSTNKCIRNIATLRNQSIDRNIEEKAPLLISRTVEYLKNYRMSIDDMLIFIKDCTISTEEEKLMKSVYAAIGKKKVTKAAETKCRKVYHPHFFRSLVGMLSLYNLTKDDIDFLSNIISLKIKGMHPFDGLDKKVRATFTREYNKMTKDIEIGKSKTIKTSKRKRAPSLKKPAKKRKK